MEQFVDHLSDFKAVSPPIAKLHKLCVPFLHLAANMLESDISTDPTVRPSIEKPQNTIPGTNSFQASPLPQFSIPGTPMASENMGHERILPNNFPPFPSAAPADDVFWQLMDTQPRLQWLDSDFSGFEQTWGDVGYNHHDFMNQ
jgi:hypothetical protein